MIDPKVILETADIMIRKYGADAAKKAHERGRLLSAEGYDKAARIWTDVGNAIPDRMRLRRDE